MPGDPKQCRLYALRCADLAHTARTPELKSTLVELSKNWMKLAIGLERTHALLSMEDDGTAKRSFQCGGCGYFETEAVKRS